MDLALGLIWLGVVIYMLVINFEPVSQLCWWRQIVAIVVLVLGAPAFFIADIGELILDLVFLEE